MEDGGTSVHCSGQRRSLDAQSKLDIDLPGLSREPVRLMNYESVFRCSSQENQKEVENLSVLLAGDSKAIRRQFVDFILNVCELLETSPTATIQKIQLALQYLGDPSAPLPSKTPQNPIFDARSSIARANSIPGLLGALSECSSWFNYELVSYLARRFGGEDGKRLALLYESQLRKYFQRLVFHCPPFTTRERCLPHGFEELTVMVDWDLKDYSLQDVTIFKSTLCHLLDIQPCAFVLRSIHECPNKFSCAVPSSYMPHAVSSAASNARSFSDEGVLSITLGPKIINFPSSQKPKVLLTFILTTRLPVSFMHV